MTTSLTSTISSMQDKSLYQELHWSGSFEDYLDIVKKNPYVTRNAFQRLYDLVVEPGFEEYIDNKKKVISYNFFKDPHNNGANAVFGIDLALMRLVNVLKAASLALGSQKRIILLEGGVGTAKSTIAALMKRGVERYSKTPAGALYTFEWVNMRETGLNGEDDTLYSPMHEEPLKLIPDDFRIQAIEKLGLSSDTYKVEVEGDLDPASRFMMKALMEKYEGDWEKVIHNHIRVKRLVLSEKDRVGVGTFEPKDEKNQDSTELTGDVNYRKLAQYGADDDPRAFSFSGEMNKSSRGILEMVEVLKLDVSFLYQLLSVTAEHQIKPKKFAQTHVDEVIIGHTNEPEFRKLMDNKFLEAIVDRMIVVQIPYVTKLSEEQKIYNREFNAKKIRNIHIAPHTVEMASYFSVLTRLEDPKKHNLSLMQKLKLYDGRQLAGYTQDTVKELRKESKREGMEGISPRYIQDRLSLALVNNADEGQISPFMVMNELEKGLQTHSLINSEDQRKRYLEIIGMVKREYEEIVKNEVQRAISADEGAIQKLCSNYVDNVKAYILKEKIKDKYSGQNCEPDERLMRSIEEKIEIPDSRKADYRREIMNFIGALAVDGKKFNWETNDRLRRALELKLFEDQKDTIKLKSLVSGVVNKDDQEKIDIIKTRMIKSFGYNEQSASDVLAFVASIFARGDTRD